MIKGRERVGLGRPGNSFQAAGEKSNSGGREKCWEEHPSSVTKETQPPEGGGT